MAGVAKKIENPFTGEKKTAREWAKVLGYTHPNTFRSKIRKFGIDNPRTWETCGDGVMRRVTASGQKKISGNKEWKELCLGKRKAVDPHCEAGFWERENLNDLGL